MPFYSGTRLITVLQKTLLLLACSFILGACNKPAELLKPEDQVVRFLTGAGNRYWRIKEIYVNNTKIALTGNQLDYYKTYTIYVGNEAYSGSFADAGGSIGKWELKAKDHLTEIITNNASGNIVLDISINYIDANNMDVQYTSNGQTVRTVYFAY